MTSDDLDRLDRLSTEGIDPALAGIDGWDAARIVRAMNAADATVAVAVERELPRIAEAVEAITIRLAGGGRLIYVGAGTSGRLGVLDASECPPTFGVPPGLVVGLIAGGGGAIGRAMEGAEDDAGAGRADLAALGVGPADAVVGIAASGRTPYVLGAIAQADAVGALTIGLVCNAGSPLADVVRIAIAPVVGPEVVAGSTRLKAGTAQKMVLNMLSTGTMIRLGKTYGNLMVDVQTGNAKLRRRAVGIVRAATGLDDASATDLLARAGGETKIAIVCALAGVEPDAARARLDAAGGNVRAAVTGEAR